MNRDPINPEALAAIDALEARAMLVLGEARTIELTLAGRPYFWTGRCWSDQRDEALLMERDEAEAFAKRNPGAQISSL